MYSRHSRTAFGLPGRLTISVRLRIPLAARLNIVRFVNCKLYARIASGIPGTIRSATASVASGITSRGENPVPPVVKSRSAFHSSQISFIASSNIVWSSGSTFCQTTS